MLVVGEQLVAVQTISERSEAAARDAGDHVHCVDQAKPGAIRCHDLGAPQELQHPIRERGSTCATAGEGKYDQSVLTLEVLLARLEGVAAVRIDLRDRRVDRAAGAAGEAEQRSGCSCTQESLVRHDGPGIGGCWQVMVVHAHFRSRAVARRELHQTDELRNHDRSVEQAEQGDEQAQRGSRRAHRRNVGVAEHVIWAKL
ncbi:MAG: hypothetical protein AW07_02605 [Candidatus Accumulibacter sp. SK-11]|nr:MAG: hypothetical protein AW07_02605 [Candidatus Accumulibacter sp. SK-11]